MNHHWWPDLCDCCFTSGNSCPSTPPSPCINFIICYNFFVILYFTVYTRHSPLHTVSCWKILCCKSLPHIKLLHSVSCCTTPWDEPQKQGVNLYKFSGTSFANTLRCTTRSSSQYIFPAASDGCQCIHPPDSPSDSPDTPPDSIADTLHLTKLFWNCQRRQHLRALCCVSRVLWANQWAMGIVDWKI